MTSDSTKTRSINDWANNCIIENILLYPVHLVNTRYLVPTPLIVFYGTNSDPTHQQKVWHLKKILRHATTHPIHYQTYELNRIQIQVCQILLFRIHNSSDDEYQKRKWHAKKNKNKCQSKTSFNDPTKKCATLTTMLITYTWKSKVIKFKLDEDPLQLQVYFLTFMNLPKITLSRYKEHKCCLWNIHP